MKLLTTVKVETMFSDIDVDFTTDGAGRTLPERWDVRDNPTLVDYQSTREEIIIPDKVFKFRELLSSPEPLHYFCVFMPQSSDTAETNAGMMPLYYALAKRGFRVYVIYPHGDDDIYRHLPANEGTVFPRRYNCATVNDNFNGDDNLCYTQNQQGDALERVFRDAGPGARFVCMGWSAGAPFLSALINDQQLQLRYHVEILGGILCSNGGHTCYPSDAMFQDDDPAIPEYWNITSSEAKFPNAVRFPDDRPDEGYCARGVSELRLFRDNRERQMFYATTTDPIAMQVHESVFYIRYFGLMLSFALHAIRNGDAKVPPMLLIHHARDPVVPALNSVRYYSASATPAAPQSDSRSSEPSRAPWYAITAVACALLALAGAYRYLRSKRT